MKKQRGLSRERFLRLSALTAGGAMLAGCNLQEGGSPPGGNRGGGGQGGSIDFANVQPGGQSQELQSLAENWKPYDGPPVELSIWLYTQNEIALAAYKKAFEKKHKNITLKYVTYPEENYMTKVNVALQARNPPDVALMEEIGWMQAGLVVDLASFYKAWGISIEDFAPGGVDRLTLEEVSEKGIFAVGDFLAGNVLVYNKAFFDEAGAEYLSVNRSLEWPEYADLCRQVAQPNSDPTKRVYGGTAPDWGFGVWERWIYGDDGRRAAGNMNSEEVIQGWNLGTALVRDQIAPGSQVISTVTEPDLFTQKRIAITWTDFTVIEDYKAARIDFGLAPWQVVSGSETFADTWTAAWGTFVDSKNQHAALTFLQFMGTDAQRIRAEVTPDPPLSLKVAREIGWGVGDPIKEEYLTVLEAAARPQPFVPPLPEGAYDPLEIYTDMTVEGQTDAEPLLDAAAKKTQPLLDQGWKDWEALGR